MVRPNTLTRQLSITGINYYVYWSQLVEARLSGDDMLFDWTNLGIMVFVVILCPLLYLCTNTLALLFQEKIVKGIAIVFFWQLDFSTYGSPFIRLRIPKSYCIAQSVDLMASVMALTILAFNSSRGSVSLITPDIFRCSLFLRRYILW